MAEQQSQLGENFMRFIDEVEPHIDSPRLVLAAASVYVELMINALVDHHCKHSREITGDTRGYPLATKLLLLNELNVISDLEYEKLTCLRKFRNKAVHEVDFSVSDTDLKSLAYGLTEDPKTLPQVMFFLIVTFWANHVDVFGSLLTFRATYIGPSP